MLIKRNIDLRWSKKRRSYYGLSNLKKKKKRQMFNSGGLLLLCQYYALFGQFDREKQLLSQIVSFSCSILGWTCKLIIKTNLVIDIFIGKYSLFVVEAWVFSIRLSCWDAEMLGCDLILSAVWKLTRDLV